MTLPAGFDSRIVNNTFVGDGAGSGIRIVTHPHAAGTGVATTTIRNNIVTGGQTGIEIPGTVDQTFILEGNDVWGNNERNWVGGVFFHLVRAENACPGAAGVGSLGRGSDGTERAGRACP
ncbi:MAG TPA: hypothetical protein VFP98_10385 [Candidatus Polarisedimenticolia bacterium]|nr:hypothetical protein [Candidatus Polarisedimenticolia bacterium]